MEAESASFYDALNVDTARSLFVSIFPLGDLDKFARLTPEVFLLLHYLLLETSANC